MDTSWCGGKPPPPLFNVPQDHIAHGGNSTHHCNGAPMLDVPTPSPATCIFPVCNPHPFLSGPGMRGAMPPPTG